VLVGIHTLATLLAESGGQPVQAGFFPTKLITGKLESKRVTSVLYQGRTHNTKQGIDQVLLPINEAKVRALEDTAFWISPLRQVFGDMGNQEAEEAVLAGTYQPPPGTP